MKNLFLVFALILSFSISAQTLNFVASAEKEIEYGESYYSNKTYNIYSDTDFVQINNILFSIYDFEIKYLDGEEYMVIKSISKNETTMWLYISMNLPVGMIIFPYEQYAVTFHIDRWL